MVSKFSDQMNSELTNDTNKKTYCYVCNIVVNWKTHEKDTEHLLKIDYFSKSFIEESENLVKCKICSKDVRKNDVNKHAIQHKLIPWHRPKDEFQKYFINFITLNNDAYWCYLCHKEFKYWFEAISHFTDPEHLHMVAKTGEKNVNRSFPLDFYKKCALHSIFPISLNNVKCFICDCLITGYGNVEKHISTKSHNKLRFIPKQTDNNLIPQIINNCDLQSTQTEFHLQYFKNFIGILEKDEHWCYLCGEDFSNWDAAIGHIQSHKHQSTLITAIDDENIDTSLSLDFYEKCVQHSIFPKSFNELECVICDCFIPGYKNVDEHISGKQHDRTKDNHGSLQLTSKDPFITKQYIESNKHQQSSSLCKSDAQFSLLKIRNNESYNECRSTEEYIQCFINFIGIIKNMYWCFICNEKCDYWDITIFHIQSSKHRSNMLDVIDIKDINIKLTSKFYENCVQQGIFPTSFRDVKCFICDHNISSYFNATGHSTGNRHIKQYAAWKISPNNLLSVENCYIEQKSEEHYSSSSQSNDDDNNNSIDENDIPETWETIIDSNYKGKIITTLELRALKNKAVNAKVGKVNYVKSRSVNKNKNETDDGWILIDSINNRAKVKDLSTKTTNLKLKSPKKSSNTNCEISKKTRKMKQTLNKSSLKRSNDTNSQVSNYKKHLLCIVCKQKLKSEVLLHIHLTSHFWPRFIQKSECQETALNLSSQNCPLNNNHNPIGGVDKKSCAYTPILFNTCVHPKSVPKNTLNESTPKITFNESTSVTQDLAQIYDPNSLYTQMEIPNILNSNSERLNQEKKQDRMKMKNVLKSEGFKPRKICNSHGSGQLTLQEKFQNKGYLVKAADIEPDKARKIDIYKIDPVQLKMINLSITRCCFLDEENIYCLICREKVSYSVVTVFEHFRSINHNDYLLEMIQDHIKFMSFPDQLSDLSLAREWIEDISDEFVECYTCKEKIENNISSLKEHLSEKNHMYQRAQVALKMEKFFESLYSRMERNWYNVRSYWCVPCCKNYLLESEFYKHINVSGNKKNKHSKQCQKFSQFTNFILDYCPSCTTLFYGFRDTFASHCQIEKHKYFRERSFYAVNQLPSAVEEMLSKPDYVINKMIESLDSNDQKRHEDEKLIVEDLETIVNHFMPAKAYPFGSRVSGLSSEASDLDVFLDCEDRYYQGKKSDDISHILKQVENSLNNCTDIWTINRIITDCNVPIIKVTHKPLGIECDISVVNGLTTECTQLIKTINQKFPLCRKLILFIKQWINMCNLSGEKGISNYAVSWMVIYYLQTKSLIPAIIELIKQCDESKIIGGWEAGANLDFIIPESNENFKDLLKGFFKMITAFDFRNNIICPLLGKPLEKILFSDAKRLLPGEMETYKQYCKRKNHELFRIDSPLCVQDPYDLSHNITKATKKFSVSKLITFCTLTVKKLENSNVSLD